MYRVLFVLINVSSNVGSDAECHFAEYRYPERRYAENRCADCHEAKKSVLKFTFLLQSVVSLHFFPR